MSTPSTSTDEGSVLGPIDLRLRFDCQSTQHFLDRHAADLSRGGIFVRSQHRVAVGTAVKLDLQLGDGSPLIVGDGMVFWTRDPDSARGEPEFGMGVRFGRLTVQSQKTLAYLLAEKAERERAESNFADDDEQNERTVVATQEQIQAAQNSPDEEGGGGGAASLHTSSSTLTPVPARERPASERAVTPIQLASIEMTDPSPEPLSPEPSSLEPDREMAWEDPTAGAGPRHARRAQWRSRMGIVGGIAFLAAAAALLPMLFPKPAPRGARAVAAPLTASVPVAGTQARPQGPTPPPIAR